MGKLALIDGDSFLYRAGFAVEKTKHMVSWVDIDDGLVKCKEMENATLARAGSAASGGIIWSRRELGTREDALACLDNMILSAVKEAGCDDSWVYLTPMVGNFRDSIATIQKYKGERGNRPYYYSDLREHCIHKHRAIVARMQEADDQISWVARGLLVQGISFVIVGNDKDLQQIPGEHYDWITGTRKTISEDESKLWFWAQVLAGDSGDNIGGCYGLGLRKASNFLVGLDGLSEEEVWPKIVRKYRDSQKLKDCPYKDLDPESIALETARLVRLRQTMDEPLWTPRTITKTPRNGENGQEERKDTTCADTAKGSGTPGTHPE